MAANSQTTRGLANLGKRLVGEIRSRDAAAIAPLSFRGVHASAYDKNPDDNINPTIVPDHAMPQQPEQYWAPHPKTGVFGPAKDDKSGAGLASCTQVSGGDESVLEQKAFFRPMEDLEKPPVQP